MPKKRNPAAGKRHTPAYDAIFRRKCQQESRSLANDPPEAKVLAGIAKAADTRGWK